jgi:IclR family acetate operon transcriptional repressor
LSEEPGSDAPLSGTIAATRVADVLLALATSRREVSVTELARTLGTSKSVTHRILRSLVSRSLVAQRQDGTYEIGVAAAVLGARSLQGLNLRVAAMPVLRKLHEATGETATVSALVGSQRVFIDQVPSLHGIKMTVELGRPYPLYAGATGKAILAVAPPDLWRHVLGRPFAALTEETIVARPELERELDQIRSAGVAVSRGEREAGAGAVAGAVFALDGVVVGAVSVCGPVGRFGQDEIERYKPLVKLCADEVSQALRPEALRRDNHQDG